MSRRESVDVAEPTRAYPTAKEAIALLTHMGRVSSSWEYLDAEWRTCGYVLQWGPPEGPRTILPVSRGPDGRWSVRAMPEPRTLYNLPCVLASGEDELVILCPDEQAAETLSAFGWVTTTCWGGVCEMSKTDLSPLAGRTVIIGAYQGKVEQTLLALNPSARVVTLNGSAAVALARHAAERGDNE